MDRLDNYLVKKGFVQSRNKAAWLIKTAKVSVDGKICTKPSMKVEKADIEIYEKIYISRAGKKLEFFLNEISFDIKNKSCLDVGSSTGGFIQILLEKEAKEVVGVDVGKDQLDYTLEQNPKVKSHQGCDIRDFKTQQKFDLVTCDLSFISLRYVIDSILFFAKDDIILLFKPQFEVGKTVKRDKKGVVKDDGAIEEAIDTFEKLIVKSCKIINKKVSKLKGKEGNVELFYQLKKY